MRPGTPRAACSKVRRGRPPGRSSASTAPRTSSSSAGSSWPALAPRPGEQALGLGCRPACSPASWPRRSGQAGACSASTPAPACCSGGAAARGRRRSRSPRPTSRGRCRWATRSTWPSRPRSTSTSGTSRPPWRRHGAPCARRPPGRARHRLGLDRLAVARRPPHGPGAGRLGRGTWPPRPTAPAARSPARGRLRLEQVSVVPLVNVGYD